MRRGIDHLVLCVSDLEAAITRYRALGFTTTPRAEHPWGTDNSLVQLHGNFLELLTLARPERVEPAAEHRFSFGAATREFLARGEGVSMLVFESADAEADRAEFLARGLPPWEPFDFERRATLPDGSSARVAFSLAFATDARMPGIAFFCCQQHAPEHFWKPRYQSHDNGADAIVEVVMTAPEPAALGDFFARVQEPDSVTAEADGLSVTTPRGRLLVLTPEGVGRRFAGVALPPAPAQPAFAGFSVRVADAARAREVLDAGGVPFARAGSALRVAPADAFGVVLELAAD